MAWRYPKYDIRSGYVVDTDVINDNFLPIADEVAGSLNEHNINSDQKVLTRKQLSEDAAFVLHSTVPLADKTPSPVDYSKNKHWDRGIIRTSDDWQTWDVDGLSMTFETVGGTTWVCASGQITAGANTPSGFQKGFGYNVALMLDGVVIFDSLLGSGDTSTDFYRGYQNRGGNLSPSSTSDQSIPQGGGGLSAALLPFCVDAIVELAPGEHTVQLAVMNIRGTMRSEADNKETHLTGYELFALEMLR